MQFSTILTLAAITMGISAQPVSERQSNPEKTLVIFKTYSALDQCSNSPSKDNYKTVVLGFEKQATAEECILFTEEAGWPVLKLEDKYKTDFNYTTYAFTSEDCTGNGVGTFIGLNDRVCQSGSANFKSWKMLLQRTPPASS